MGNIVAVGGGSNNHFPRGGFLLFHGAGSAGQGSACNMAVVTPAARRDDGVLAFTVLKILKLTFSMTV